MNDVLTHATTWMKLEITVLNERSPSLVTMLCDCIHIKVQNEELYRDRK